MSQQIYPQFRFSFSFIFSILFQSFFSKNVYYLGEYISGILQINQEKIVNTIVKTKDEGFIKQILENDIIVDNLDEEYKNILESSI